MTVLERLFPRTQTHTKPSSTAVDQPNARSCQACQPLARANASGQFSVAQTQASEPRPAYGTSRGSRMKIAH